MSGLNRYDFAVVGGGIVGACLAEELACAGASVLVLDSGPRAGDATAKAAGVAVPSLRYLGDREFYRWLVTARRALDEDIARLEPAHGQFSVSRPLVRLLGSEDLRRVPDDLAAQVLGAPVPEGEWDAVEPAVRVPGDRRAFLAPDGLMVNGPEYLSAVRAAAVAAGATWWQGPTVTQVDEGPAGVHLRCAGLEAGTDPDGPDDDPRTDRYEYLADRVVLAAGAWTGRLAALPVGPQRGQLAILERGADLRCVLSGLMYLAPMPGGQVVVGSSEEDVGFDERYTTGVVLSLLAFAVRVLPDLRDAPIAELRGGLRPVTGTGRPLAGRVPGSQRLYVAAGHAGHGLISARLTGRGMAAGLVRGEWDALPEQFCPSGAVSESTMDRRVLAQPAAR